MTAQRDELARRQAHAIETKQQAALAAKQALLADRKKQAEDAAAEVAALEAEIAKGKGK